MEIDIVPENGIVPDTEQNGFALRLLGAFGSNRALLFTLGILFFLLIVSMIWLYISIRQERKLQRKLERREDDWENDTGSFEWVDLEDTGELPVVEFANDKLSVEAQVETLNDEFSIAEEESGEDCGEQVEREEAEVQVEPEAAACDNKEEAPVIRVNDVTMTFQVMTGSISSMKEYVIKRVRRQVRRRDLLALNHVSFEVRRGEVVGIIGTNGSGKSTLLKIVSGALKPTSGNVEVNRRKIQILTLGTGFDAELTARENVYLNGSIIGYTKEFIDEHYDWIVEFAELDGFMDEKVKNFSSGMVSRLGFAIATAGDAAEILILDEVLSVGDEFFRKKSMERIKEMIHGGSTVLIVSHSIGTITEHCTKAVWIEKGELKMVGEPKAVCGAYRGMAG